MVQPLQPYDPSQSASKETRVSHKQDMDLREAGYEIHARPAKGQPLWKHRKSKKVLTQKQALKRIEQREK